MYTNIKKFIFGHRFVSLVILALGVVLVSTLYYSLLQSTSGTKLPVPQATGIKTHVINSVNPTMPPLSAKTYTGNSYQVAFPLTWTQDTNTAAVYQNNMLALQPDAANPSENAHVAIEINSTQDTSVAKISSGLTLLGFHRINTTVAGIAAQKFTGTVTLSQKVLHNIAYVFVYKEQVYLIKLSYQGSTDDPRLEQEFNQSVSTFTLH